MTGAEREKPITCCDDPQAFRWDGIWWTYDHHRVHPGLCFPNHIAVTPCCHKALLEDGKMTGPLVDVNATRPLWAVCLSDLDRIAEDAWMARTWGPAS